MPRTFLILAAALLVAADGVPRPSPGAPEPAVPNDNRVSGGRTVGGALDLRLEARLAAWRPDPEVDSALTVHAFAEVGGPPSVPGPLLRATSGSEVRVRVHNAIPDSTLVVRGLRAGTVADDTLHVAPGTVRTVRFRAGAPGTYLYWGTTTRHARATYGDTTRDATLAGAIVIDPAGTRPDPRERIFVLTLVDIVPDSTRPGPREDVWELAINGRSWPHTERIRHAVGDTVRWRWVNATAYPHPMHLHGFHFRVLARGDGRTDTAYAAGAMRDAVTELMLPGSTFRMTWMPTRAGNWLMHCHMIPHITPFPARADSVRAHDAHDVARHARDAMAGLVLGIVVRDSADGAPVAEGGGGTAEATRPPARRLRVLAQRARGDADAPAAHGYVLQRGAEPRADSVEVPGSPLVLVRGETTAITVVNRLAEATTVHWHGMELESVYDGVAGWSGTRGSLAPLVAPGDSFTVVMTPPRAGTFIYHTHMDEGAQLTGGMYGPLLVLEPGERFDPETDRVLMIGRAVERGESVHAIDGRSAPPPLELRAGTRYRLRLVNILPAAPVMVELLGADSTPVTWHRLAKDGAALPPRLQRPVPARVRIGVGETYDFAWTPATAMEGELVVKIPRGGPTLRRRVVVSP